MSKMKNNYLPNKLSGLEFCLAIGCPLNCHYCPQDLLKSRYQELYGEEKIMSFDTFKICLGQVIEGCGITFCGMVEPFINPNCAKMIKYAYDLGYKVTLFTTLIGMKLQDVEILQDVYFEDLTLHLPDCEGNMNLSITEEYMEVLKAVHDKLNVTGYSCHGTVREEIRNNVKKELFFSTTLSDRAGNLKNTEYLPTVNEGRIMCNVGLSAKGFGGWVPIAMPNGALALCCMDYGLKHPLGNLRETSYAEIVQSAEFEKFVNGLAEDGGDTLCRTCSAAIQQSECDTEMNIRVLNAMCIASIMMDNCRIGNYEVLKKLNDAKHICVYGLGKLFKDSYIKSSWDRIIQADILSDGDSKKWGKKIGGIECIPPDELTKFEDLLVVVYVKDGAKIIHQLKQLGIWNVISVYEIFNALK